MFGGGSAPFCKEPNVLAVGRLSGPGNGILSSLHVVISASRFLLHDFPCFSEGQHELDKLPESSSWSPWALDQYTQVFCLMVCACRKSGVSQVCSEDISPPSHYPDFSGMGLSQGISLSP